MAINENNQRLLDDFSYYLDMQSEDEDNKRKNTTIAYKNDSAQFLEYLGDVDMTEAKLRDANDWLKSLKGKDGGSIKAATRNRKLASLNQFYKQLIEWGECDRNPFSSIGVIKIKKDGDSSNQTTRDFLEKEEIKRFKKVLDDNVKHPFSKANRSLQVKKMNAIRDRALFNLMLSSGMRVEEVCLLEVNEIIIEDGKNPIINIPILKDKSKGGRKIPVPTETIGYIEEYRNSLTFVPRNEYVFLSQNGEKLTRSVVADSLLEYADKAKIDGKHLTPHSTRHTYGTHMVNSTNNLKAIATIMGHGNTKMLESIYWHESEEINEIVFRI